MGTQTVQSNLTAGEFSPLLHSRIDVDKYAQGVAKATNMVIMPHGGMRRRPGLAKQTGGDMGEEGRMVRFIFNTEQTYIIYFRPGFLDILRDGIKVVEDFPTPYTTMKMCDELDAIQAADTMFITHGEVAPQTLIRDGSDSAWKLEEYVFLRKPPYDNIVPKYINDNTSQTVDLAKDDIILNEGETPKFFYKSKLARTSVDLNIEDYSDGTNWVQQGEGGDAWDDTRGWPRVVTLYQGRLWLAGSKTFPNTVWGSRTNGRDDFTQGADADHALFDTLDTDQLNEITNLFTGRSLQVFTTSNEFYNRAEVISPTNSQWSIQTGYGAKRLRPILVDGATYFVDSSKRSIRSFLYNFDQDSYVADNITLISSHLIQDVVAMDSVTGTATDISDFVYVVNVDGTVAVLNTLKSEGILGWTQWTTEGKFLDVVVLEKDIYFLIERNGGFFIEKLQEGSYTDHNVQVHDESADTSNIVHGANNVVYGPSNVVRSLSKNLTIQTDFDAVFEDTYFSLIGDLNVLPKQKYTGVGGDNDFIIETAAFNIEVGLNYPVKVLTLPISASLKGGGATLNKRKRVTKVYLNIFESLGVYARNSNQADRLFIVTLDSAAQPYTGIKEIYLLGYNKLMDIEITQPDPLPFTLRSITHEITY